MYLDNKNIEILDKYLSGVKLNSEDKKILHRTKRAIQEYRCKNDFNKKFGKFEELFL